LEYLLYTGFLIPVSNLIDLNSLGKGKVMGSNPIEGLPKSDLVKQLSDIYISLVIRL
jgi:hypothetical protein